MQSSHIVDIIREFILYTVIYITHTKIFWSNDNTIRIWSYESSQCTSILEGYGNAVNSLTSIKGTELIVSGSYAKKPF